jgi:hypothetical protein
MCHPRKASYYLIRNKTLKPICWPRGLRRRPAAARLVGLRVRIPPGTWMMSVSSVNVVCCEVEVSATGRSLVQRSPIVCVCVCVTECDQVQK